MSRLLPVALLLASLAATAAPMQLNHQGRLMDPVAGVPLSGQHDITFNVYDSNVSTTPLWSETLSLTLDEGYYAATLGKDITNPLVPGLFLDNTNLFLELEVDGTALPDRQVMVSVPYAIASGTAENVDGGVVDASEIRIGGNVVIDSAGQLAGGVAGTSLDDLVCAPNQIPLYDGTSWGCTAAASATVSWADVTGKPAGFDDGFDDDTLGALTCANGFVPMWDAVSGAWVCFEFVDSTLDEAAVEGFVTNGPLDLAAGTQMGSVDLATVDDILTEAEVEGYVTNGAIDLAGGSTMGAVAIATTDDLPSESDIEDAITNGTIDLAVGSLIDGDLIAGISDLPTEADIEAAIVNGPLDLDGATTIGGAGIVTSWTNLPDVPGGFSDDIDDDLLGTTSCAANEVMAYVGGSWICAPDRVLTGAEVFAAVEAESSDLDLGAGLTTTTGIVSGAGVQIGDDSATCNDSNAGTLRWSSDRLEICAGTGNGWALIASPTLGTEDNPGADCAFINAADPAKPSGTYWIDPNGGSTSDAFQAYCDMTPGDAGWTLCASLTKGYVPSDMLYNADKYAFQARMNADENYVYERDAPARTNSNWNNSETLNYGQFCREMASIPSTTKLQWKTWNFSNNSGASQRNQPYDLEMEGVFDGNLYLDWFTNSASARTFTHISGDQLYVTSNNNGYGGPYVTPNISWANTTTQYTHSTNPWGSEAGCVGCTTGGGSYTSLPYGQTSILNNTGHAFWSGIPNLPHGWSDCTANGNCDYHESGYGVWLFWVR